MQTAVEFPNLGISVLDLRRTLPKLEKLALLPPLESTTRLWDKEILVNPEIITRVIIVNSTLSYEVRDSYVAGDGRSCSLGQKTYSYSEL